MAAGLCLRPWGVLCLRERHAVRSSVVGMDKTETRAQYRCEVGVLDKGALQA